MKIDTEKWKEFKIDNLFEKIEVNALPYRAGKMPKEPDSVCCLPALTSSGTNHGLSCYVPYENASVLNNCVSVASNGAVGIMFYHENDFTILQDAYAIRLKNGEGNREIYLFLITCMQKVVRKSFSWSEKATWNKVKKVSVPLPVNDSGSPDFTFMEEYIRKMEETVSEKLTLLQRVS